MSREVGGRSSHCHKRGGNFNAKEIEELAGSTSDQIILIIDSKRPHDVSRGLGVELERRSVLYCSKSVKSLEESKIKRESQNNKNCMATSIGGAEQASCRQLLSHKTPASFILFCMLEMTAQSASTQQPITAASSDG
eukprot:scaffold5578_cov157-Skeletonema_marinoi.AAC.5